MGAQSARIGDALRKHVSDVLKMLALEIDRQLRKLTPVDTGHARRNWVPSVGSRSLGEVDDESAHATGIAQVLSYKLTDGSIWVANAVAYIRALNYGHSQQAPAGFIELAIDTAFSVVRQRLAAKGRSTGQLDQMHAAFRSQVGGEVAGNVASAYSPFGDE